MTVHFFIKKFIRQQTLFQTATQPVHPTDIISQVQRPKSSEMLTFDA